ncbi:NAD-dependent epimerase/dehydratase family protein [Mycobacterium sp. SMC-4]|uniref:NAD-dependent epimerase/dehydratase family protein n=1 Tax=Mycobacterium sp. SMC-4 TaxID=2857059 RepID=UPI003D013648
MTETPSGARVAVTGATGFVGQAVVKNLADQGYRVIGISQPKSPPPNLEGLLDAYFSIDLREKCPDFGSIDGLIHLAGLSSVGASFSRPQDYIATNSQIVTNLFESALAHRWEGRAILVSSGALYGAVTVPLAGFSEDSPVLSTSPYVISKILIEKQAEYYGLRGVDVIVARPFNHIGPGQKPGFIVPDLVQKVVGSLPGHPVTAGNLNSSRDYTDVRDVAEAYRLLLECASPVHKIYNVCSGLSRSGREILNAICKALNIHVPDVVEADSRAIDPSTVIGNGERIRHQVGWEPIIDFQTSINDFVECYLQGQHSL